MFAKLFTLLSGRTTAFCAAFFLMGNVMHYVHRLDATYIGYMTALLGFVIGHSIKEDIFAAPKKDDSPKVLGL